MFTFRHFVLLAAGLLWMGTAALAQSPASSPRAEGVPRAATAPGVTRAVAPSDSSAPDQSKAVDSSKPETAHDDQKNSPETATDDPPAIDAKKAQDAAKQGVQSNTPPTPKP